MALPLEHAAVRGHGTVIQARISERNVLYSSNLSDHGQLDPFNQAFNTAQIPSLANSKYSSHPLRLRSSNPRLLSRAQSLRVKFETGLSLQT